MEQMTAGLTVFGRLNSVNVQKVVWAAHELGINYHRIDAGAPYDLNKENPKFLGILLFPFYRCACLILLQN